MKRNPLTFNDNFIFVIVTNPSPSHFNRLALPNLLLPCSFVSWVTIFSSKLEQDNVFKTHLFLRGCQICQKNQLWVLPIVTRRRVPPTFGPASWRQGHAKTWRLRPPLRNSATRFCYLHQGWGDVPTLTICWFDYLCSIFDFPIQCNVQLFTLLHLYIL